MKRAICLLTCMLIFCLNSNAQNYLNKVYDFQNRHLGNGYTNLFVSESIYLTEQINFNIGNILGFEIRDLSGNFNSIDTIKIDSLKITTGQGECLIHLKNNFYCVGATGTSTNYLRSYLVKLNGNFDTVFTKTYDLPFTSGGSKFVKIESKNNYLFTLRDAQYLDTASGLQYIKGFITKLDTLGNIIWQMSFGSNNSRLFLYNFKINADGSFFILGSKTAVQQNSDFYIMKADSLGNVIWQRSWGALYNDAITDLFEMPDGNILVCGLKSEETNGFDFRRAYLALLSPTGNQILWQRTFFGLDVFNAFDTDFSKIFKNNDGTYHIWGDEVNYHADITRPLLMTFSSNFDSLDVKYYSYWNDPGAQNYLRDIVRMPDNGYMACGFGWDDNHGEDGWLLRIDSNGCANVNCTPLAIQDSENETEEFRIYPNPANDKLAIQCKMASLNPLESTCKVLDATGREVLRINKMQQNQSIDISELSVGLYVLSIQTSNGRLFTNKFLVSR